MKESSVINNAPESSAPVLADETPAVSPPVTPLSLQQDAPLENSSSYNLSDLLKYHDRTFVVNVYAAIARQAPSPADLDNRLHELRSGLRTKTEIVEDLVASYPNVRVDGLSSPATRNISRWPVIGYILRLLRSLGRLPLLVQHQQQFEAYLVGQQQRTVDYVNEVLASPRAAESELLVSHSELAENVSDAIKTTMMLSDSLVELSANLADGETRLQNLQAQVKRAEAEFRTSRDALMEQFAISAQHLQRLQTQHEQSEARLHADLVALTKQLSIQQERLGEIRRSQDATAAAQREFLIDEQRAIVEAQRAVLSDLQDQLNRIHTTNK
jgi:hypothetical protein